jgi:hypothetical protein
MLRLCVDPVRRLQRHLQRRPARLALAWRGLFAAGLAALLSACAGPKDNVTLIPAGKIEQESSRDGVFTQPLKWQRSAPGCEGACPTIKVDALVFPGNPQLTRWVDEGLAQMTTLWQDPPPGYADLAGFEAHFWRTAAPRDAAVLGASTRYRSRGLTVLELNTWLYVTGASHGISATRFLNWDNRLKRLIGLRDVLLPGQLPAFDAALREAHAAWLARHSEAQDDPAGFARLWPFQPTDNFALTDAGMVIKYDAYAIAPYASGQPELTISYSALQGVLKPEYLPQ